MVTSQQEEVLRILDLQFEWLLDSVMGFVECPYLVAHEEADGL